MDHERQWREIENKMRYRERGEESTLGEDLWGFVRLEGFAGAWSVNSEKLTVERKRE